MSVLYIIASVLPAMVALFWCLTLLSDRNSAFDPKKWLGIFMLAVFILYSCHALVFTGEYATYFKVQFMYQLAALSVYPLFYNYIQLMSSKKKVSLRYLFHFIPAVVIALLTLLFSRALNVSETEQYIDQVIKHEIHDFRTTPFLTLMQYTFRAGRLIFGLQVLFYTYFSIRLIKDYRKQILNFYSNVGNKNLDWLHLLTAAMFATGIMGFIFNLVGRSYFIEGNLVFIPSIIFSCLVYIIGLQGNQNISFAEELQNDIMETVPADNLPVISAANNIMDNEQEQKILMQLQEWINDGKYFLNTDLKISDLTRQIGTNRTYLSHVINQHYQMHFNDFVNYHRIQYAKELIGSSDHHNLSMAYIAETSGFGSLTTFNRNFKKFEKITPHDYRETIRT